MTNPARPIYESAQDRERQEKIAKVLALSFRSDYEMSDRFEVYDCSFIRDGNVKAICEIKSRVRGRYDWGTIAILGGYMVSKRKMDLASKFAEEHNVPLILAVEVVNGIYYTAIRSSLCGNKEYGVKTGGRSDRADMMDFEACYYFPCEIFKRVGPSLEWRDDQ